MKGLLFGSCWWKKGVRLKKTGADFEPAPATASLYY